MKKNMKKCIYLYMYNWVPLLYSIINTTLQKKHNIAIQLYFNEK